MPINPPPHDEENPLFITVLGVRSLPILTRNLMSSQRHLHLKQPGFHLKENYPLGQAKMARLTRFLCRELQPSGQLCLLHLPLISPFSICQRPAHSQAKPPSSKAHHINTSQSRHGTSRSMSRISNTIKDLVRNQSWNTLALAGVLSTTAKQETLDL